MAADVPDQYYTEVARLESFHTAQPLPKRRGSNATGRAPKSMKWPHSWLGPEQLAAAGFFFLPSHENPDNVKCFLCRESICGWEKGDNPLEEHLKLSPGCGWAVTSCIEARLGDMHLENPMSTRMVEARKATFGDRWPHEGKKGWKCKTKQLVEAGWIHKPTPEGDDYAECVYCTLALDGWEPADKPFREHHARSQDCAFFTLCNQPESPIAKKAAKGRKPRASKTSRLSTQSAFTEAPSIVDIVDMEVDEGDSVMTTATTASKSTRKAPKGKKAPVKGRKKKEEPIEVSELPEPEDEVDVLAVEQPKPKRGKKRASEAMEDTASVIEAEAPPPKRRTRGSIAVQDSVMGDVSMEEATITELPAKKAAPKRKGRQSKTSRQVSTASQASLRAHVPDDDEIDKMLQDDLKRPLSDEEDAVETKPVVHEEPKASVAPTRRATRTSKIAKTDHDIFSAADAEIDEAALEAELEAMEIEESKPLPKARGAKANQPRKVSAKQTAAAKRAAQAAAEAAEAAAVAELEAAEAELAHAQAEEAAAAELEAAEADLARAQAEEAAAAEREAAEAEAEEAAAAEREAAEAEAKAEAEARRIKAEQAELEQQLKPAPKARAGRTSKAKAAKPAPTRATRGSTMSIESMVSALSHQDGSIATAHDDSGNETDASQATVVRGGKKRGSTMTKKAKGSKKAPIRNIEDIIQPSIEEPQPQEDEPAPPPQRHRAAVSERVANIEDRVKSPPPQVVAPKPAKSRAAATKAKGKAPAPAPAPASPSPLPEAEPVEEPTPQPAARARAASITPSPSPQSSDAENRPPSPRPNASAEQVSPVRIALAATPGTPSRRNVVAGLKSVEPWVGVDLDDVFGCLRSAEREKENFVVGGAKGRAGEGRADGGGEGDDC
ncbi:hypothetical protein GMDG_01461 [Pseudogymnoascus destructans 20631-21]|uniref:Uncharacterized protein n=1 Tax=Pseudogymnoascus destructans (strain ATCC MYA-4855 / 20631-21) TaxID=658429 RepID=L8FTG3_PSED2|nr:hypothetical protein GMDG_01461 [Pseudogymnoascus destructans 20631-21]